MTDKYARFANTIFGSKLTSMLGFPQPIALTRFDIGQREFVGRVLIGSGKEGELVSTVEKNLESIGVSPIRYNKESVGATPDSWNATDEVKALIFDATGIRNSEESPTLFDFFHSAVRSVQVNGRILILGRPPEQCESLEHGIVQRALEGFAKSLAKELRKAINVQLIYVEDGAEHDIESTMRFFLSPKSAYVTGQVVRLTSTTPVVNEIDWSKPLKGKRVLVTGASQGIGVAIAEAAARDGAHVICLDIPPLKDALSRVAERISGSEIAMDLTSPEASQKLLEAAQRDGGWDVIVHNAGITRDKTIAKMSEEWWSQVIDINLSAQQRINQALISSKGIRDGGRIICVSSISGIAGNRGQTNYAFSKAGVIGMVQQQAPLLKKHGITINAVAPGFIETEMTAAMPFTVREAGRRLNSLSQGGVPMDVAEAICWFASPASSALNGNVLRVCGQSLLGA